MSTATSDVIAMSEKLNTDLRTAAYALAITRLNDYYNASGLIM
jgi:glutamate dehydrogenase/leucine dehydrogenase